MRRTLGTTVFSGMIGVTIFGIFLTPVFFYVIDCLGESRLLRLTWVERVSDALLGILSLRFLRKLGRRAKPLAVAIASPRSNGLGTNGHGTNGHGTNGHGTNGHGTDGHGPPCPDPRSWRRSCRTDEWRGPGRGAGVGGLQGERLGTPANRHADQRNGPPRTRDSADLERLGPTLPPAPMGH